MGNSEIDRTHLSSDYPGFLKEAKMREELRDYQGTFRPNIAMNDFSKETLIELMKLHSRLFLVLDAYWYLAIKESINNDKALECDLTVWDRFAQYELPRLCSLLKIEKDGISGLFKAFQFMGLCWFNNMEYDMKLDSENHGLMTVTHCPTLLAIVTHCPTLLAIEKEGSGREKQLCQEVETFIFKKYAEYFDCNILVEPLKIPPRENRGKGEICCQWEFKKPL
jgi:hypothetical protein